jgi:hypothetical protein
LIRQVIAALSAVVILGAANGTAWAGPVEGALPDTAGVRSARELFRETLRASGITGEAETALYESLFEDFVAKLSDKAGRSRSSYRRGLKMHRFLQKTLLRRYNATADGIHRIFDKGEFNCVSATLLYGIAARALGLDASVVESPRHIFLRLNLDGREVDIECTSPDGYDIRGDVGRFSSFVLAYKHATPRELRNRGALALYEEFHDLARPVSLEKAIAFLLHNTAERALDRGEGLRAAEYFLDGAHRHPVLAYRSRSLASSMARAFRVEYEAGGFDAAYRVAEIDLRLFPGRTTALDRLLAAALKRIERACDAGNPWLAGEILESAVAIDSVASDRLRLEREACPRIAAAAVLAADWDLALRMSERFAAAEPDHVEGERLLDWVELRFHEGSRLKAPEYCSDLTGELAGLVGTGGWHGSGVMPPPVPRIMTQTHVEELEPSALTLINAHEETATP